MKNWKKLIPDLLAVLFFVALSMAYFWPAVSEGKILNQHDSEAGIGAVKETGDYHDATGEQTRWTNALFGGMPTYQIAPSYGSSDVFNQVIALYHLYLPAYVWYIFALMLGFYILLRAFDFRVWMAALGAIVWAFSSYFFIIIAAGHIWKVMTLAYIPPTIAGMVLCYRGKMLTGGVLTSLFAAMQIRANHVQMSYYFLFCMLFMAIAYLVEAARQKQLARFARATGVLVVAGLVAIGVNISNLYHTYEYSKETMRGKSELVKDNTADQTNSGLERSYITQWSYGIGETWSLLVPNVKGGASSRGNTYLSLSKNDDAMEHARPELAQLYNQLPQYWGEQPGTQGPVYVGALIFALFILGAILVKGPMKWALLGATFLSFLFAWGKNYMPFTDFCIDYIPMYAKFRAVSSALVIAEFTIPLLALLGLKELLTSEKSFHDNIKPFLTAFGATAGVALLFALFPNLLGTCISSGELEAIKNGIDPSMQGQVLDNLNEMRSAMFTADAWRSFGFVVAGALALLLYGYGLKSSDEQRKQLIVGSLLIALCLLDMWNINQRYLSNDMFVPKSDQDAHFTPSQTDLQILEDKSLDYRVLNLATSTFNENNTSYFHKSIGGYHAAKLRRYQELIETHIQPEISQLYEAVVDAQGDMEQVSESVSPVVNMLNTKYLILPVDQEGNTIPLQNLNAMGNAWFVNSVQYVNTANEELENTGVKNPRTTAVVDGQFKTVLNNVPEALPADSTAQIKLVAYAPNHLKYEAESQQGGVVVFSEIYYPDWTATIDGNAADIARADYVLRAMYIPAGKHVIEMTFDPQSIHTTEAVAWASMLILLGGIIAAAVLQLRRKEV